MLRSSPFIFFEALKYALPASIFFFKFLEWWYSPDNARRRQRRGGGGSGNAANGASGEDVEGSFNLAPPKILLPHSRGVLYNKLDGFREVTVPKTRLGLESPEEEDDRSAAQHARVGMLHNACPICGTTPINNPTAFPTGYVCCYTCAFSYVVEHARCPVTLQHVSATSELRRVLG